MQKLSILMAQINPKVGAIKNNAKKIIDIIKEHQEEQDLIIFPELVLSGYPPEDLLLRNDFYLQIDDALNQIANSVKNCHVIIGHPHLKQQQRFNAASVFYQGQNIQTYHKQHLPNYGIFDEVRYFIKGEPKPCIITVNGYKMGLCICEDLWQAGPVEQVKEAGAQALICINASPFDYNKYQTRTDLLKAHAQKGLTIIYVNQISGQDELLFDGQSLVMDEKGEIYARAPAFREILQTVQLSDKGIHGEITPLQDHYELIYNALVFGTKDYVLKNNFPGVLLGLSGGIDSALTLAIAVDALGTENVHTLMMPSRYTADISTYDAMKLLDNLNVSHSTLSIEPAFNSLLSTLAPEFTGYSPDITEENMQARIRAILLMAMSNKTGKMVLTTSNKSETAVGYTTLYGDMAGGFAVLKDVLKTQVYELAKYVNRKEEIIPERILTRPPSAELAANQTDQDTLPEYTVLDELIHGFMEMNLSAEDLIQQGHSTELVKRVIRLIVRNEYKRRQAPPGIRISPRAFGKDWRYPITSGAFQGNESFF
ncbi:NAD+ synthase [Legionella israelensis]|uniref:Glutamine-dependent NAD(+) synthetase n=1 Tax=Legionella israelensis TaxID=454 RepID=A0AAX1EEK6_9GAMM|nr:NAD+ synthase [Legionella israelensis]QBR83545.1 NAD+ synthase [Legionella israelensis]